MGRSESDTVRAQDAEAMPVLAPPTSWPPRIPATRAPRWVRLRDLVLTLVAWAVYLWIMREPFIIFVEWLSPPAGEALKPFEVQFGVDIRPDLWIIAGLLVFIVFFAVRHRRRLQRQPDLKYFKSRGGSEAGMRVAAVLSPEDQFAAAGLPTSELAVWHGARRLTVFHDERGRIVRIEGGAVPEQGAALAG